MFYCEDSFNDKELLSTTCGFIDEVFYHTVDCICDDEVDEVMQDIS